MRRTEVAADRGDGGVYFGFIGDITDVSARTVDFVFERGEALGVTCDHRDAIATGGETAAQCGAGARANAGDEAGGLRHGGVSSGSTSARN